MPKFKVGDTVIAQHLMECSYLNGYEGTVVEILSNSSPIISHRTGFLIPADRNVVGVSFQNGEHVAMKEINLRLKKPPASETAWAMSKVKELLKPVPQLETV